MKTKKLDSFYQFISLFETYHKKDALWTSDEKITLTYSDLVSEIFKTASYISKVVKPGERVILLNFHGPHWVIVFFSVILNKAIVVPIDARISEKLKNDIIK